MAAGYTDAHAFAHLRSARRLQCLVSMGFDPTDITRGYAPAFGAIVLETQCPQCAGPIPLNGPTRFPSCPNCDTVIAIGPDVWEAVFRQAIAGGSGVVESGTQRLTLLSKTERPHCTSCNAPVPLARAAPDGMSFCFACGRPFDSFPSPPWLSALVPDAVQIVGAVREGQQTASTARRWFVRFETAEPDALETLMTLRPTDYVPRESQPPRKRARVLRAAALALPIIAAAVLTYATAIL